MAKSSTYQAVIALGAKMDKTFGPTMKAAQKGIQALGNGVKIAAVAAGAGLIATGTAAVALGKMVVNAYGELEQNLGGSEAVFGAYASKIQKIGEDAYKNLGVSQSDYLATANKMGALFQGSGVEQQKSLELTEKAMQRAADMASVMGIDMQVALDSVAGAAKGNFTMMDNLGVAMNATNIQAYALEKGINFKWSTATQAQKAEIAMQMFFESTQQYAGNFAKESTETISGSFGLLKASTDSFIAGLGNKNANMANLTANVVDAFKTVVKNVKPIAMNMLSALPEALMSVFPKAGTAIIKISKTAIKAFVWIQDTGQKAISFIRDRWQQYGAKIIVTARNIYQKAADAFNRVKATGQTAIGNIQAKFLEVKPKVMDFIGVLQEVGGAIKEKLQTAFELARPTIEWIFSEGFPKVIEFGGSVLEKITGIYNFVKDNWSALSPIVFGVVGAFTAYKVVTLATKGVTVALTAVQKTQAAVQLALNAAMNANPAMLIAVAIGALIAVGVLLYKNWDTIKEKAFALWDGIKSAFGGVADWFGGIWEGVKSGFKAFVNFIIRGLNKIPEALNSLSVDIPDWVPGVGGKTLGFKLPTVPEFYKGVSNFSGGVALVGERGPELVKLPRGSDVFSNRETGSILSKARDFGDAAMSIVVKVQNIINGPITKEQADEAGTNIEKAVEAALARIQAKNRRVSFQG